mmetsp:Transcript_12035/g.34813  ORF Transcript_12035/g.34813 Transcript_12035/m.34813 type:complete len:284 (-) Transcript_12035:525-1376(-)
MRPHQVLSASVELLYGPYDGILVGQVRYRSHGRFEGWRVDVRRNRDDDLNVVGHGSGFELRTGFDHVFDARAFVRLDHGFDPNQRLDMRVQTVRHQVEFSVGRDEGNGAIVFEPRKADALMEFDVLQFYGLAASRLVGAPGGLEHELVVESQLELGHSRQERLHLHGAIDLGVQHGPVGGHQQVELLDDVQEDFVLLVLDAFRSPRDGIGERNGRFGFGVLRHAVGILRDEGSEDVGIERLRHAVVHGLVEQFVNDDEVVADGLLLERAEVILEKLRQLVQER